LVNFSILQFTLLKLQIFDWTIDCLDLGHCKLLTTNICGGVPREVRFKSRTIAGMIPTPISFYLRHEASVTFMTKVQSTYLQYSKYRVLWKSLNLSFLAQIDNTEFWPILQIWTLGKGRVNSKLFYFCFLKMYCLYFRL